MQVSIGGGQCSIAYIHIIAGGISQFLADELCAPFLLAAGDSGIHSWRDERHGGELSS